MLLGETVLHLAHLMKPSCEEAVLKIDPYVVDRHAFLNYEDLFWPTVFSGSPLLIFLHTHKYPHVNRIRRYCVTTVIAERPVISP
jgi:hypothetical protein